MRFFQLHLTVNKVFCLDAATGSDINCRKNIEKCLTLLVKNDFLVIFLSLELKKGI